MSEVDETFNDGVSGVSKTVPGVEEVSVTSSILDKEQTQPIVERDPENADAEASAMRQEEPSHDAMEDVDDDCGSPDVVQISENVTADTLQ